jgi:hypothetical protein
MRILVFHRQRRGCFFVGGASPSCLPAPGPESAQLRRQPIRCIRSGLYPARAPMPPLLLGDDNTGHRVHPRHRTHQPSTPFHTRSDNSPTTFPREHKAPMGKHMGPASSDPIRHKYTTVYAPTRILVLHRRRHGFFFGSWASSSEAFVADLGGATACPPLPESTTSRGQTHVLQITLYRTQAHDSLYTHAYTCGSWMSTRILLNRPGGPGCPATPCPESAWTGRQSIRRIRSGLYPARPALPPLPVSDDSSSHHVRPRRRVPFRTRNVSGPTVSPQRT